MKQIGLRLDEQLLALVDRARGDVPREVFMRRGLSVYVGSVLNGLVDRERLPTGPLVAAYPEASAWPPA
jgi:hypothetical protein